MKYTLKFSKNHKTISKITNSNRLNHPIHILSRGILLDASDTETVCKMLDSDAIRYRLTAIEA